MRKLFLLLTAMACLGMAGCLGPEGAIKDAIRAKLKDPASATFSDFVGPKTLKDDLGMCSGSGSVMYVQVNSKNSYGGYTGKQQWVAFLDSGGKLGMIDPVVGPIDEVRTELLELWKVCEDIGRLYGGVLFAKRLALLGDFSSCEKIEEYRRQEANRTPGF